MILALLHDGKRFWNKETRTNSLTSGPRSPTKMECSAGRSSRLYEESASTELMIVMIGVDCVKMKKIPSILKTTARGPVQLKWPVGARDRLPIASQRLGSCSRAREINEAIAGIAAASSKKRLVRLVQYEE